MENPLYFSDRLKMFLHLVSFKCYILQKHVRILLSKNTNLEKVTIDYYRTWHFEQAYLVINFRFENAIWYKIDTIKKIYDEEPIIINLQNIKSDKLYLEGKHGDEWLYNWTGRHRKRGTKIERTVSLGFSGKIGFKIDNVGVELSPSASITNKITVMLEDCALGNDIARYCNPLPEQKSLGDFTFKLTEK